MLSDPMMEYFAPSFEKSSDFEHVIFAQLRVGVVRIPNEHEYVEELEAPSAAL